MNLQHTTNFSSKQRLAGKTQDSIIEKWLLERQELLVLYYQLSESHTMGSVHKDKSKIDQFCESLMDYVSLGHFTVFEKLVGSVKNTSLSRQNYNRRLLENILFTTDHVLNFNDKYANVNTSMHDIVADLSKLGEQIAERLDWEDELLDLYLGFTPEANNEKFQYLRN